MSFDQLLKGKSKIIACVGSRQLKELQLAVCKAIGEALASQGYVISSGNGDGADQAFQAGANSVDGSMVSIHLPWDGFNKTKINHFNNVHVTNYSDALCRWNESGMSRYYGDLNKIGSRGVRLLFARNLDIVDNTGPEDYLPAGAVIAWPGYTRGTRSTMTYAALRNIPVFDISNEATRKMILELLGVTNL